MKILGELYSIGPFTQTEKARFESRLFSCVSTQASSCNYLWLCARRPCYAKCVAIFPTFDTLIRRSGHYNA